MGLWTSSHNPTVLLRTERRCGLQPAGKPVYADFAYLAFTISQFIGFFPALIIAPILCGVVGAAIEIWGLRRVHHNGHIAELLFTFGLVFIIQRLVQMTWGMLPMAYRVPPSLDFPLFVLYGVNFPAYRGFMLLVSATMLLGTWPLLKRPVSD